MRSEPKKRSKSARNALGKLPTSPKAAPKELERGIGRGALSNDRDQEGADCRSKCARAPEMGQKSTKTRSKWRLQLQFLEKFLSRKARSCAPFESLQAQFWRIFENLGLFLSSLRELCDSLPNSSGVKFDAGGAQIRPAVAGRQLIKYLMSFKAHP